jgi:hypothetical protein
METKEKKYFKKYGGEINIILLNDIVDNLYGLHEYKFAPAYSDADYKWAICIQLGIANINKMKIAHSNWGDTKLIKFWYAI